jgi:hypothetical protein
MPANVSAQRSRSEPSTQRFLILAAAVAAVLAIPFCFRAILSSGFLPHTTCYLGDHRLILLNAITDALIWLSYVAIASTLVYLVGKARYEIPFHWMFLAFGVFIIACGFTHLMEVVTLWSPVYWVSGYVKNHHCGRFRNNSFGLAASYTEGDRDDPGCGPVRTSQSRFGCQQSGA